MLEPDNMRATGERVSDRASSCVGSSGGLGDMPRLCAGFMRGLLVTLPLLGRSGEGSVGGGAAGNLKLWEKELDGFLVPPSEGVLGAVDTPGARRPDRVGRGNS